MIEMRLHGTKEWSAALNRFSLELQTKVIDDTLREGIKVVARDARKLAPKRSKRGKGALFYDIRKEHGAVRAFKATYKRHLKNGIGYGIGKKHNIARSLGILHGIRTMIVGLRKGAMHGVPVHFGHKIVGWKKGETYITSKGKEMKNRGVVGQARAIPFIRKAMNGNAIKLSRIMSDGFNKSIRKHMGKAGTKMGPKVKIKRRGKP